MDRLSVTLGLLGLSNVKDRGLAARLRQDEARLGRPLPDELRRYYSVAGLLDRVGTWFGNKFQSPGELRIHPRSLPGDHPGLLLVSENQGVCDWVAALDGGEDPPVYVVGDLVTGDPIVEWAPSLSDFMSAVAWDVEILPGGPNVPMIQAQGGELDAGTLGWLRDEFIEGVATSGWPCVTTYRFRRGEQAIELWSCPGECDWSIVARTVPALESLVADLLGATDLDAKLWSSDPEGEALLASVRSHR